MYENLTIFISAITVIFGLFGIFLFLRLLKAWKNIDPNIIKARVFLAEKFVLNNLLVIFIVGLLIAFHNFIEFLSLGYSDFFYGYLSARYPARLISVTELLVALLMVEWLMYQWIKITKK